MAFAGIRAGGLTPAQMRCFMRNGFVTLPGCFSREAAAARARKALRRAGYDPKNPRAFRERRIVSEGSASIRIRSFAPKAWAAICQLVGGEARIDRPDLQAWRDSFIIKFPARRKEGIDVRDLSWHKDGGPGVAHFLDSAEMGLVAFAHFSDAQPRGGCTILCCDSVAFVARWLAARPEGASIADHSFVNGIHSCSRFVELSAQTGDVTLMHPFMLHAESANSLGPPRLQTARIIKLKRPMRFDRPRREDFSPVERSILQGLRLRSLKFRRRP